MIFYFYISLFVKIGLNHQKFYSLLITINKNGINKI